MCQLPRLLITSGISWHKIKPISLVKQVSTSFIWQLRSVHIISRFGLITEACHRNQSNKSKVGHEFTLPQYLKQLYISNKTECFSCKSGCGVCGHTHIKSYKEKLAWSINKWLQVNNTIILFTTVIPLRN